MSPDQGNYEYLTELYGSVDGSIPAGGGNDGGDGGGTAEQSKEEGNRRDRRGLMQTVKTRPRQMLFHTVKDETRRLELLSRWNEIDELVNSSNKGRRLEERVGWRLLHRTEYGEAHEIDLGESYKAQIHMLRA